MLNLGSDCIPTLTLICAYHSFAFLCSWTCFLRHSLLGPWISGDITIHSGWLVIIILSPWHVAAAFVDKRTAFYGSSVMRDWIRLVGRSWFRFMVTKLIMWFWKAWLLWLDGLAIELWPTEWYLECDEIADYEFNHVLPWYLNCISSLVKGPLCFRWSYLIVKSYSDGEGKIRLIPLLISSGFGPR